MIKGKWILGNEDCTVPVKIRSEVFAGEFGLSGYGANKEDNYAMHAVLYDDSTPVASSRIYYDREKFLLDSICVRRAYRGQQIGDLLARLTILRASEYASVMYIHCFKEAADFFKRYGFEQTGDADKIGRYPAVWLHAPREKINLIGKCGECMDCHGCKRGETV